MAKDRTKPGEVGNAIAKALAEYSEELAAEVDEIAAEVAKELLANTKATTAFSNRTGEYRRRMAIKQVKVARNSRLVTTQVWHVKGPDYRLTHLLEHGHVGRDGRRVEPREHIGPAEQTAVAEFERRVKEAIEG